MSQKCFYDTKRHLVSTLNQQLENLAIFTGKYLCWSLFLIKLQAFRSLLYFTLKTAFLQNTSGSSFSTEKFQNNVINCSNCSSEALCLQQIFKCLKSNNRNTRKKCMKHFRKNNLDTGLKSILTVNLDYILHLFLVLL